MVFETRIIAFGFYCTTKKYYIKNAMISENDNAIIFDRMF